MKFKFFLDGAPQAFIRNNDFNRMEDHLANHCKREETKFLVELEGKRKVWVDYSEPFGKEANYPNGQEKLEKITKDVLTKESLLPSEITGVVGEIALIQKRESEKWLEYSRDIVEHKEAIKTLSSCIKELQSEIRNLKDERKSN